MISKGVWRQDCLQVLVLFLIDLEMLYILIKSTDKLELSIFGQQIIVSQLANDTALNLKNKSQMH